LALAERRLLFTLPRFYRVFTAFQTGLTWVHFRQKIAKENQLTFFFLEGFLLFLLSFLTLGWR